MPQLSFTNERILEVALRQSAVDAGCQRDDFLRDKNVIVASQKSPGARKYLELPFSCHLISYGSNVVASVSNRYWDIVSAYIARFPAEHCFETPNLHILNDALEQEGQRVCFMAEYFLPDLERLTAHECPYPTKLLGPKDFGPLYLDTWSNALCEKRRELDVLDIGAYDGRQLVGFAACSADCEEMWQIGVDVLPDYRKRGIASALTSRLALEILKRGKVPFYCCAWSNVKSARNAVKSGFHPAWVELTAKEIPFVENLNQR